MPDNSRLFQKAENSGCSHAELSPPSAPEGLSPGLREPLPGFSLPVLLDGTPGPEQRWRECSRETLGLGLIC